ncbi:MAG: VOC family protein [Chloroflexi bacterium]|nr:VOC family protein [Chloroflexota bacterium]MDA1226367.1 VOC family protein [Chloroflexota bacterium]
MIRHVAGIAEVVEDVGSAVRYYTDVLGLSVEHQDGSGYAVVDVPGVLHYGLWSRRAAAEATFGDPQAADRIPLGFSVGFEVDNVEDANRAMLAAGTDFPQAPKEEPWKQVTSRFISRSGALCEISKTPWARRITQQMRASEE